MVNSSSAPATAPSTRVDQVVFHVRWIAWLLAFLVAWITSGNLAFPTPLWVWFGVLAALNLLIGLLLYFRSFPPRLAVIDLVLDTFFFALLPYLATKGVTDLISFSIFPALVGAIRFGPKGGFATAGVLSLSVGAHALLFAPSADPLSTALIMIGLTGVATLIGFLAMHEKDDAVNKAAGELHDLRGAMAGAKIFYKSADVFSVTTSYKPVLEGMLEAGVQGLPEARREDGPAVGIALFFDDQEPKHIMRVVASRHLDKPDGGQTIAGKSGIVAETLKTGAAVVFDEVNKDSELAAFSSLQRCHSGVCYPLQAGLEQYGVVVLATPAPRRPSSQHLDLMRAFTSQAGIAFQNAKLYQNSRLEQDKIIHTENEMRQKLARDLHDGPTQKMAGLVMQLDYMSHLIDQDPAEVKLELEKARGTAQQTVKEIRTALFSLRPLALETKGLSAALDQYGERLRDTDKQEIKIQSGNFGAELDTNIAATVFAIIDEAVTNARKHAQSASIAVSVEKRGNALVAIVRDEGRGFDVDRVMHSYQDRTSLGLQNMRDRAILINGELRIESAPGQGTRVTLVVPLPPPTPEATH